MSRIPSNTEQFFQGVAQGNQNLALASQNQRAKMDYSLAQQQMGLERQRMAQQGQQFQQGLQAEAQNYQQLNASRERMQQAEMAQQQGQFQQSMDFNREQNRLEQMISLKMKQLDMDLARNEQEIAAMADNDPRVQEARAKRVQMRREAGNLKELIAGTQAGMGLAQGLRADRLSEIEARVNAFKDGVDMRRSQAQDAFQRGFEYSVKRDTLEGGFFNEAQRVLQAYEFEAAQGGERPVATSTLGYGLRVLLDNAQAYFTGRGDPELARKKTSEFMRNGGAMASTVLYNTLDMNAPSFGLEGPEKAAAAAALAEVVSAATIMTGLDPRIRGTGDAADLRQKIATNVGKLRQAGMGDEQISALFDGLQDMSSNRTALLETAEVGEDPAQMDLMDKSLAGVGRIGDMIENVLTDQTLMRSVGGPIEDLSKIDMGGVIRKAQLAYGMSESPEMTQLARDLDAMGMSNEEVQVLTSRLIEADPRLQFLRPEQYTEMLRGLARQAQEAEFGTEMAAEDIGRLQAQVAAEGRVGGLNEADQRLAEIAGLLGG